MDQKKQPKLIIKGPKVYSEKGAIENGGVVIANKSISQILATGERLPNTDAKIIEFPPSYHLIPGMIDLHLHGMLGADIMDADFTALDKICHGLPAEGTTAFLATTMSANSASLEKALRLIKEYKATKNSHGAEIVGIHLEGPFLSPARVGAQRVDYVVAPDVDLFDHWQNHSHGMIKLVTLAPEQPNALSLIKHLKQNEVVSSIGHSDARYNQTLEAIEQGCSYATHLFNAMSGIHHRQPGAALAILQSDAVTAELIVDGVHLHPSVVNLAYETKGKDRIVLVTDSIRAKCMAEGNYELGGQEVRLQNNQVRLPNGRLAGSVLRMQEAIRNMVKFTNCSVTDLITMTAENPAKKLNIFQRKGSITVGKDADIVVLNKDYQVVFTLCRGKVIKHD